MNANRILLATGVLSLSLSACIPTAHLKTSSIGVSVPVMAVSPSGAGESIGTIMLRDGMGGLQITTSLNGLPPGEHGFHIHQNASCAPSEKDGKMVAANAAGSHYDPDNSGKHGTPQGPGHRGDLPALLVSPDGSASRELIATRLTLAEVRNRSIMIHAGGDNHSDHPEPLGGGGARIYCGVIE